MTLLNVFDRQERIAHWNQQSLREARITVVGRDFAGAFLTSGLGSLGVGEILWVGRPRRETELLAQFLLADPPPWGEGKVYEFPFDVENGSELDWSVGEQLPQLLAIVTENPREQQQTLEWTLRTGVPALVGSTAGTGWFGASLPPEPLDAPQNPTLAMIGASLALDAMRELICPLPAGMLPLEGPLGFQQSHETEQHVNVLQIGVGGIGAYSAAALAAALGPKLNLRLWDFDRVDPTNLNPQGLFTVEDAHRRAPKAHAAMRSLNRLFPQAQITSEIRRLGPDDARRVASLSPRPDVLLSAVDNAASRLTLQQIGQELSIPVIQSGTSLFAADCYTQQVGGPSLDDQMYGALREAVNREKQERARRRHRGGCAAHPSYIVPVMMAGGPWPRIVSHSSAGIRPCPLCGGGRAESPSNPGVRSMSSTTLTNSLSERVAEIRGSTSGVSTASRLPAASARSLLVDVLLADFAQALPELFASRVRTAGTTMTAMDLMFAAAVYRAVADDPFLAREFLARVDADPRAAGLALARALAAKQEPPPRDAAWHRRDCLGLMLQIVAVVLIVLGRYALFVFLAAPIGPPATPITQSSVLPVMLGLDLFRKASQVGSKESMWLTLAVAWTALEASAVPHLLEFLRRLPAVMRREPPPLPWRIDAFHVVWYAQTVDVEFLALAALCRALALSPGPQLTPLLWTLLMPAAAIALALLPARDPVRLSVTRPQRSTSVSRKKGRGHRCI